MAFEPMLQWMGSLVGYSAQSSQDSLWKASIAPAFRRRILVHLVRNALPEFEPPLFLGIQGPPGEGKSFQIRATLLQANVQLFVVSGGDLGGSHEGDAIEPIGSAYLAASDYRCTTQRHACVLIEDFDLSVASSFESVEYTVNSQLLSGFLMNLADNPRVCKGQQTERIPIFVTGNNLTRLYAPLMRHGRFDLFDWAPDQSTKAEIVNSILGKFARSSDSSFFRTLVDEFPNEPISFFSSLSSDIVGAHVMRLIDEAADPDFDRIVRRVRNKRIFLSEQELRELAQARSMSRPHNFLERDHG